ncbi:unnamed protein product [Onchocerca flexuosa]|uniref:HEAT repeat protein n=1 Tax=Onchocerca flexuosa TaxID=387005 RepID=A0A183I853_9BILA|nr:unnamed protein product [Onchocerca flexuosa]
MSDSVRRRMIKERVMPKAEEYWFMTDHAQLRAAAAELFLNLLFCEDFFKEVIRPGTDRLKLWVLYSAEEDERLALASSAGFAILTESEEACKRIIDEMKSWPEILRDICMSENIEIQRRGLIGIANMVQSSEKVACEIVAIYFFVLKITQPLLNYSTTVINYVDRAESHQVESSLEKYSSKISSVEES